MSERDDAAINFRVRLCAGGADTTIAIINEDGDLFERSTYPWWCAHPPGEAGRAITLEMLEAFARAFKGVEQIQPLEPLPLALQLTGDL
mgnify:CR=1 FL=1